MDDDNNTPVTPGVEDSLVALWLPSAIMMLLLAAVLAAVAFWRYRKGAVVSMSVTGGLALMLLAAVCGLATLSYGWLELFRWVFGLAGVALLVYAIPPVRRFVDGHAPFMRQLTARRISAPSGPAVSPPRPPEPPGVRV